MDDKTQSRHNALAILLVEDSPVDAQLIGGIISRSRRPTMDVTHASSMADARTVLRDGVVDLILLDLTLGDSQGLATLDAVLFEAPDVAVVVVTGDNDEEIGIDAVSRGAQDFLVKEQISGTVLLRSVRYAIERGRLANELRQAFRNIQTLRGLLPICARCKKIRNDGGYWQEVESYIGDHTDANFSHSFCPGCADAIIAEVDALP
jgi:DNA-binding NarL/FixJ family response regulator